MFAADGVVAFDEIARFVQDWEAILFRISEDGRQIRDFDEPKVNRYMPKSILELIYADAVFRTNSRDVLEADR